MPARTQTVTLFIDTLYRMTQIDTRKQVKALTSLGQSPKDITSFFQLYTDSYHRILAFMYDPVYYIFLFQYIELYYEICIS